MPNYDDDEELADLEFQDVGFKGLAGQGDEPSPPPSPPPSHPAAPAAPGLPHRSPSAPPVLVAGPAGPVPPFDPLPSLAGSAAPGWPLAILPTDKGGEPAVPAAPTRSLEELEAEFRERLGHQGTTDPTVLSSHIGEQLDLAHILRLIEDNDVTFIATETGTGKSTMVPKGIFESHQGRRCKIACTQPRRTATVRVATTVAELCNKTLGAEIGYWMRGEKKGDDNTILWYMTSYTLLLHLLNKHMESEFTHIILDEFHERQPEIEMLAALLRDCLQRGARLKLVLMSATLTMDDWESYFQDAGLRLGKYTQGEGQHPVHEYFLEEASVLTGLAMNPPRKFDPSGYVHPSDVENSFFVAQELLRYIASQSELCHSILVFLPGRADAEKLKAWADDRMAERFYTIIWHSHVDLQCIQKQLVTPQPNRQKIYLATDIAEVSITLADVVFVVDLGLVKRPIINQDEQITLLYPPLVLQWISKSSLRQRKGRVGRTQQGFYFSMLARNSVDLLPEYPVPPIRQTRLDDLTLNLFHISNNPMRLYMLCCIQPSQAAVEVSVRSLLELGTLYDVMPGTPSYDTETRFRKQFQSTFTGQVLQRLPVSVHPGMLIFFGLLLGLDSLMILSAAITQSLPPFVPLAEEEVELVERGIPPSFEAVSEALRRAEASLAYFAHGTCSDVVACLYALLEWRSAAAKGDWAGQDEEQWCQQRSLSLERLKAIDELYFNILDELDTFHPSRPSPKEMLDRLNANTDLVVLLVSAAFAHQAVVMGNTTRDGLGIHGGTSLFVDARTTLPDIHAPTACNWACNAVNVPVQSSLRFGKIVVSQGTTLPSDMFFLVLLTFSYCIRYSQNPEHPYLVAVRNGRSVTVRLDEPPISTVLETRRCLCRLQGILLYRREKRTLEDGQFRDWLIRTMKVNWAQEQTRFIKKMRSLMNSIVVCTQEPCNPAYLTGQHVLSPELGVPPDENIVEARVATAGSRWHLHPPPP
eukprot:EG_transcript_2030